MAIKMTLPNGTVIEGTAEELAELNEIIIGEEKTFSKPAQVGDIIRITDARITEDEYENGDIMTVEKMLGRKVDNEGLSVYILEDEFEIIARPHRQSEPDTDKPSEGDIVVITGNTNRSRNDVGDVGLVGDVRGTGAFVNVPSKLDNTNQLGNYTYFDEMRLATDEEKAKYYRDLAFAKAGRKPDEFKRGDIISTRIYGVTEVERINHFDESGRPIKCRIDGKMDAMMVEGCTLIAPVESRVDNHEEDSDTHA